MQPVDCLSVGVVVADHLCTPIDKIPRAGELELCEALPLSIGGCAANMAMDLARVGESVGVIGAVGQDVFGRFVIQSLQAAGVETSDLRQLPHVGTAGTLIINVAGEDRRFIHARGANAVLSVADISLERVKQAKVLYVGGYLLLPEMERPGELARLFAAARAAGVITVLDVVLFGPHEYWSKLADVLPETDVFLPNDDEAAAITGLSDPLRAAERFLQAGARAVVITCGGRGTLLLSAKHRLHAQTYPTTFVGGTGAGDAFDAGYITGLLAGDDPSGCLRWGSALGASCVRSVSATDSVFTRPEAMAFMQQHELKIERV